MRLVLAQIDCVVGDLEGNRAKILSRIDEARLSRADLIVFPELATTGYPPEDLLLRPGFVRAAHESLEQIAVRSVGVVTCCMTATPTSASPSRMCSPQRASAASDFRHEVQI